ncbi:hypothetical protein LDENG_00278420 [Lucifuga dentata]|nr:hypothetical protein LDENG_00278420 [Lucifuga dentata]
MSLHVQLDPQTVSVRLTCCYCLQSSFCLLKKFICDKFYVPYSLHNHSTRNNIKSMLMNVQNKLALSSAPTL